MRNTVRLRAFPQLEASGPRPLFPLLVAGGHTSKVAGASSALIRSYETCTNIARCFRVVHHVQFSREKVPQTSRADGASPTSAIPPLEKGHLQHGSSSLGETQVYRGSFTICDLLSCPRQGWLAPGRLSATDRAEMQLYVPSRKRQRLKSRRRRDAGFRRSPHNPLATHALWRSPTNGEGVD